MGYCFEHNRSNCDVCADDDGYVRGQASGRSKGEAETVAAIVAWLREQRSFALTNAVADAIERGEWKR